jgi:ABC-2 type transport system ATP-binding protein
MTAPQPPGRPIGKAKRASLPAASGSSSKPRPVAPWEVAEADTAAGEEPLDPGVLIQARGLTKEYGDLVAVDHLDLQVRAGEVYGLLGPNGAGKTTTILMLLGLSEPTDGEARVVGLDPTRHPLEVKRIVGYLPDNVGFYGSMSGRANLRYTAALNGLRGKEADDRVAEVLDQVGLADAADKRVDQYSRGMRQRLGIADALVSDPMILILDEPTIAIDPQGVAEILDLIQRLVRDRGLALLLSSHLLEQVQSICDRVGIFVKGRLVAQGTVEDLTRKYGDGSYVFEVGLVGGPDAPLDRQRAVDAFRSVAGVSAVEEHRTGRDRWRIKGDRDVSPELAAAVAAADLRLRELMRVDAGLDTIYRRAVAGELPRTPRPKEATP